jgi:hypothetical protein
MDHFAWNTPWRLIQAAAISALLMGTASAQIPMPAITLNPDSRSDSRPLTKEEQEKKQAREDAYKSALKSIPNKNDAKPVDPWANMRPNAPASSNTKRGQQ